MRDIQRFLIIAVLINFIIGLGVTIYENPTDFNGDKLNIASNSYSASAYNLTDNSQKDQGKDPTGINQKSPVGNVVGMSSAIWDIFMNSVNPFIFTPDMFNDSQLMQIFAWLMTIFRMITIVLIGLEVYLIFVNKKN